MHSKLKLNLHVYKLTLFEPSLSIVIEVEHVTCHLSFHRLGVYLECITSVRFLSLHLYSVKGTSWDCRLSTPASEAASALIFFFFSDAILIFGPNILQRTYLFMILSLLLGIIRTDPTVSPGFEPLKIPPESIPMFFLAPQLASPDLPCLPSCHLDLIGQLNHLLTTAGVSEWFGWQPHWTLLVNWFGSVCVAVQIIIHVYAGTLSRSHLPLPLRLDLQNVSVRVPHTVLDEAPRVVTRVCSKGQKVRSTEGCWFDTQAVNVSL